MSDLEAVLADVSYLMAMEKSKTAATKAPRKHMIPDSSVRSVISSYIHKKDKVHLEVIFNELIGFNLFEKFIRSQGDAHRHIIEFYNATLSFEQINSDIDRIAEAKRIYDVYIMPELLQKSHRFPKENVENVQALLNDAMKNKTISRQIFLSYTNILKQHIKETYYNSFLKSQYFTRYCQWIDVQLNTKLTIADFSIHRIIGRGGFGEVYGCRKLNSGKMYAIKCLDKKRIKMKSSESMALEERTIMSRVSSGDASPFIVCMTYAFQTPEKLCFILDLMNGGDLNYHLSQHGVFTEEEVKFYAAEILLGLEHMHERNIVYRDLKPANILLDECGHIRISDLGLAYDVSDKWPTSTVGTHGYMAPEVLQKGTSYAFSADWYSFGCTIFKLLVGSCPFRQHGSKSRQAVTQQILVIPETFSDQTKALLIGLLQTNIEVRLGCTCQGAKELKKHDFFSNMDWELAKRQQLVPPLIPPQGEVNAADAFEIGAFDEEDTQGIRLSQEDQDIYKDFDIVIAERWQHEMMTTIFDAVNEEFDQIEHKRLMKLEQIIRQLAQSISGSQTATDTNETDGAALSTSATCIAEGEKMFPEEGHPPVSTLRTNLSMDKDDILSWPADLLLEWWLDPEKYGTGPSDCIIESKLLRLGGPFLHTWQKKHVRLFPNRLEIYAKTQQGIPLKGAESISMLDIGSIYPTLQKVTKYENVIIIVLKNQSKIFFTSQDQIIVDEWLEELLLAFQNSSQVLSAMSRKVYWIYGIDEPKLYARAAPSSSVDSGAKSKAQADLQAKRKNFKRMQSFQTVITNLHSSPPVQQRSDHLGTGTGPSGRLSILKNLNRIAFARSQDVSESQSPR